MHIVGQLLQEMKAILIDALRFPINYYLKTISCCSEQVVGYKEFWWDVQPPLLCKKI